MEMSCKLYTPVALLPGKKPRYEFERRPASAEIKNVWSYTSTSQYAFMGWYLVKHRDNFTLTFTAGWAAEPLWTR
jgi:hypothetical protein